MAPIVKNEFFLFTPFVKNNFVISLVNYIIGILGNLTLLSLWWLHLKTDSDPFSIIVIGTDLTSIFSFIAEAMAYSLQGFNDDRLGLGAYHCIAIGVLGFTSALTNLFCVTLYAYQRYLVIFKKKTIPLRYCFIMIAIYYVLFILIPMSPLFFGESFIYRSAGTYCMYDWNDTTLYMLFINLTLCLIVSICISSLTFMYYQIIVYNHKVVNQLTISENPHSEIGDIDNNNSISERQFEMRLVKRVAIIVLVCFLCYSPFVLGGVYEILTGNRASPVYDAFASGLIVASGLGDFIVFITTNSSFRRSFWGLFGLDLNN